MNNQDNPAVELLIQFRALVRRWQAATLLPIDQVILTLAQDLFTDAAGLAVAHKLAFGFTPGQRRPSRLAFTRAER